MKTTLHREYYVDRAWFDEESKNIFHNDWFCIGRLEDFHVAGDYKLIDIAGQSLIILRGSDDNIRGFYNFCRHRGCELVDTKNLIKEGNFKRSIRCPYHSWTYDLNGKLLNAPHLDIDKEDNEFHLKQIYLEDWGGFLFINVGKQGDSFTAHLHEIPKLLERYPLCDLKSEIKVTYEVNCNWKVILENYNECYHCAGVHPELCEIVPSFRKNGGSDLDWEKGVPHKKGANTFTMSGTTTRKPFPGLNKYEKERHFGQALYPNLLISLAMDHVAIFIIKPTTEKITEIEFRILFHSDEISNDDFDPSDTFELWDITNKQDWDICERVQRGMSSKGFEQGYYAEMEDENLNVKNYIETKLNLKI